MMIFLFIALAAVANAMADVVDDFFYSSKLCKLNPKFWDNSISWMNKWKNGDKAQGEKFFGSSTFLVFLTDGWHLLKTISLVMIFMAIALPGCGLTGMMLLDVLIYYIFWGLVFEGTYRYLKTGSLKQ